MALLEVKDLKTYFYTEEGIVRAVDGVSFTLEKGEVFGLVGETGCGKTVTALSIMRLVPEPGRIVGGNVIFKGEDLLKKKEEDMRRIRGKDIAMIFQDPLSSLNPVCTIGNQISEVFKIHQGLNKKDSLKKTIEMLKRVNIPFPEKVVNQYPHELSGGMRQRCMIAMALSCNPELLIADEPTTALDVTIQAQIIELLKKLIKDFHSSVLLISHNLGLISEICDKVAVMYAGTIVEFSSIETIFQNAKHPYTMALIEAIPKMDKRTKWLKAIDGAVPDMLNPPDGCKFHPRCPKAFSVCSKEVPEEIEVENGHKVTCHLYI
ncbi:MAG: ABC transporter ATP-binding protein [Candidatus Hydrothermarchaeota archaeon]